jgi:hypothetical protein
MRAVSFEEAKKFLINPEFWVEGEHTEADIEKFYQAQVEKLQAFGFNRSYSYAINEICTPTRSVALTLWVFSSVEILLRHGFDYYSAARLIRWATMVAEDNLDKNSQLQCRLEEIFRGLGFPEMGVIHTKFFFENILPGISEIVAAINWSSEQVKGQIYLAAEQTPVDLKIVKNQIARKLRIKSYDQWIPRQLHIWAKKWLADATLILHDKFGDGMSQDVAIDLVKMICIAAQKTYEKVGANHKRCKYNTQDLLLDLGLRLNEQSTLKFFEKFLADILREISIHEDAGIEAIPNL